MFNFVGFKWITQTRIKGIKRKITTGFFFSSENLAHKIFPLMRIFSCVILILLKIIYVINIWFDFFLNNKTIYLVFGV